MKKKHPAEIPHYEDMDELVEFIVGKLRYDKVAEFYKKLSDRLENEAEAEAARGRKKLYLALWEASLETYHVVEHLEEAWKICEPYTE